MQTTLSFYLDEPLNYSQHKDASYLGIHENTIVPKAIFFKLKEIEQKKLIQNNKKNQLFLPSSIMHESALVVNSKKVRYI